MFDLSRRTPTKNQSSSGREGRGSRSNPTGSSSTTGALSKCLPVFEALFNQTVYFWLSFRHAHPLPGVCPVALCTALPCSRFQNDHARPNLIWNLKTREELRDALEGEMRAFGVDRELGNASVISWNHQEFEVSEDGAAPLA